MSVTYAWRGAFTNSEANALHAEAFETRVFSESEWNWEDLTARHSLGWVTGRDAEGALVGFVNVIWDGLVHAWLPRHHGVGAGAPPGRWNRARP